MCKPLVRSFGAVIKYDCWKPTANIYRKNELYHFREKLGGLVFLEYLFSTAFFDRPLEVRGRYADRIITSYIILSGFCVQNDNNRCIQIIIYLALVQISVQLRGLLEASVDSVSVKKTLFIFSISINVCHTYFADPDEVILSITFEGFF